MTPPWAPPPPRGRGGGRGAAGVRGRGAAHGDGLLVRREVDAHREGGARPAEVLGELLRDLVAVAVDGLLAEDDEVGLLGLDDLGERAGDEVTVERLVVGDEELARVRAHGERLTDVGRGLLGAERGHHDAVARDAGLAVLDEPEGGLDGVLVEGVDLGLETVGHDLGAARGDLDLVGVVGVRRALEGDEDLHGTALLLKGGDHRLTRGRSQIGRAHV